MTQMDPTTFDFKSFAQTVAANVKDMLEQGDVFRVDVSGDLVWDKYISSFPEGTNPVFRERTYHEGNYDKNFIRRLGNIVTIQNGVLRSIWDMNHAPFPYDTVTNELSAFVKSFPVNKLFRIGEALAGHENNYEILSNGTTILWKHFVAPITKPFFSLHAAKEIGEYDSKMKVFQRGLNEITQDAVTIVIDLIDSNNIYRGEEFSSVVNGFKKVQDRYIDILMNEGEAKANIFVWSQKPNTIKNSSIGSLLEDVSKGVDLERAVASYESKVAPQNYKRSSSVITQKMVKEAFEKIESLGLKDSLSRRHANISDVSINDVIWVDRSTKSKLKGQEDIFDVMMSEAKTTNKNKKAEDINIVDFLKNVVPQATEMEVLVKNKHQGNFMSITAPQEENSPPLFKWDNGFAWSYNGDITDSYIATKVKAAGGNITAPLRVSLAWYNYDDLDIHAMCPDGHIYFGNRKGILDVDMNVSATTRSAVENLAWKHPKDGKYEIKVKQFTNREAKDVGFTIEVENNGIISHFTYDKQVRGIIDVIEFTIKNGVITNLKVCNKSVKGSDMSQDMWGITTEKYAKVRTIVLSPNYWEGSATGNKHWFFILENCMNPEPTRGIYNEFLRPELKEHRKVFEVLGSKTKCEPVTDQLSGIGFSSTKNDELTVQVTGDKFKKLYNVKF